jgi:Leucine-rich repeat (LRR) protein
VKAVEKLGGVVVHDYRYTSKPKPTLPAPSWLLNLLGEDFFSEVVQEYQEYASRQIDRGQEHLRAFPHLKRLEMLNSTVGDAELEPVSGLAELEILNVGHTRITDNGLEHLQGLRQLQELWLNDTQVTDRGLVYLQKLHHLHYLNLTNTQVTDKGVGELQQALPKCCITR